MKFTLKKIHGGYHPIIYCILNGEKVEALIDTGANISCHGFETSDPVHATIKMGSMVVGCTLPHYKIPGTKYLLLIGSNLLLKAGAVIDYRNRKITFLPMRKALSKVNKHRIRK